MQEAIVSIVHSIVSIVVKKRIGDNIPSRDVRMEHF